MLPPVSKSSPPTSTMAPACRRAAMALPRKCCNGCGIPTTTLDTPACHMITAISRLNVLLATLDPDKKFRMEANFNPDKQFSIEVLLTQMRNAALSPS